MDYTLKITDRPREITGRGAVHGMGCLQDLSHRIGWLPHGSCKTPALHTMNSSLRDLTGLRGTNSVDSAPKRLMCTTDSKVLLSQEKLSLPGAQVSFYLVHRGFPGANYGDTELCSVRT